jgi:hypothetical protein
LKEFDCDFGIRGLDLLNDGSDPGLRASCENDLGGVPVAQGDCCFGSDGPLTWSCYEDCSFWLEMHLER